MELKQEVGYLNGRFKETSKNWNGIRRIVLGLAVWTFALTVFSVVIGVVVFNPETVLGFWK